MPSLTLDKTTLFLFNHGQTNSNESKPERAALITAWSLQVTSLKQPFTGKHSISTSSASTPPLISVSSRQSGVSKVSTCRTASGNTVEVKDGDDKSDDESESAYSYTDPKEKEKGKLPVTTCYHYKHATNPVSPHCCLDAPSLLMPSMNRHF